MHEIMDADPMLPNHAVDHRTRPGVTTRLLPRRLRSTAARYSLAMLIVVLTTSAIALLRTTLTGYVATIQLLYVVGVMFTAVLVGTGPAFLAAVLSFLYASYFFAEPRFAFSIADPEQAVRLVAFLTVALLAGEVAARAQRHAARAEQRLVESQALYKLSRIANQEVELARTLQRMAQTTAEVLRAPFCAIQVMHGQRQPQIQAAWGTREPGMLLEVLPLTVRNRVLGRLELAVAAGSQFDEEDQRLFHLLAHQIAQSLEQDRLMLEAAQAQVLAESDRLKSAILSSVSHDLRTPLTTIQGAVDELLATDVTWSPAHREQLLVTIHEQAGRLNNLVNNLLDLSRIRAGAVQPRKDWYALDEVILHALDSRQELLAQHTVTLDIPQDLPLIPLDFILTEQVLENLLRNAVNYAPPGTLISIAVQVTAEQVTACVADRGPGIPEDERQRIFDPFYRRGDSAVVPGIGLGLAICQGFVVAQGGRIWVEDNPGGGARVCFALPREVHQEGTHESVSTDRARH